MKKKNMNNKRIIYTIVVLIMIISVVEVRSQQIIHLEMAIETGKHNNDKVKMYKEKIKQKESEIKIAFGNYLPNINLSGGFTHMNEPIEMDLDPIRQVTMTLQAKNQVEFSNIYNILQGGTGLTQQQRAALYTNYFNTLDKQIPKFSSEIKKMDFWNLTLSGMQPLFMGGKIINAKKFAEKEKEIMSLELKKSENEIANEIINSYLNVVLCGDLIKLRKEVLDGMKKHRNDAKRLMEEGLIAKHEYLRAEVAVADAERVLFDEENKLSLSTIALKSAIGIKGDEEIIIEDSLVFNNSPETIDFIKKKMEENQPVFQMLKLKREEAEIKQKIDKADFLPKVYLFGKYEIMQSYLSIMEPEWTVGIHASINIFNGFKDYEKLKQDKYILGEIEYLEADTKRKMYLLIEKSYKEKENSINRYKKLETNINLAEENLRFNSSRFSTGLGTALDVIDAELVLEKNQFEKKLTLYEYYKTLNELYTITGEPENILEIMKKRN